MPLDPAYPKERLAFIMQDSQVSVLLTQRRLFNRHPRHNNARSYAWIRIRTVLFRESASNPGSKVIAQNLAYIIYTSGTTGNPKGVMIEHGSLVNYMLVRGKSARKKTESLPLITRLTFDASLKQLFAPLLRSRQVWILSDDVINDRLIC